MNGNGISDMNSNNGQSKPANGAASAEEAERKLFVGGLTWDTTEDDLRNYFTKFGTIQALNIKYDAVTKASRGYGFVTFTSPTVIDTILASAPHKIRDKLVDAKKSNPKPIFKKVFCGGIDGTLPEEEIRKYFSKYGKIEALELPFDKAKGKRREFCFVIYESEEAADAAVALSKQTIGGRECDVKKAQPQNVAQQQKRQAGSQGGNRPNKLGSAPGAGARPGKGASRDGSAAGGDWSSGSWQEGSGYDHSGGYGYPGYPGYPPPPPHNSVGYPPYDAYHSYPNYSYPAYPSSGDPYWNGYAYPDASEYSSSGYGASGSATASSASSSIAGPTSSGPLPSHHSGHPPHHASTSRSHHMPPPPHLAGSTGPHPSSRGPSSTPSAGKMSRSRPGNNSSYHPYPRN